MIDSLKEKLYFLAAWYFRFWAQIKLSRWNPRTIIITGSSGKTTLMHFVESQLTGKAKISHHANSSIGVPFDILGIERPTLRASEWPGIILLSPFKAFAPPPTEEFYVVECDCDRPGEGKFLSEFLKPEITLWISISRTHTMNFDNLVTNKAFTTVEEAVAYEFGYFIQNTQKLVIINGDSELMRQQTSRTKAEVQQVSSRALHDYTLSSSGTNFTINQVQYSFQQLHPKEVAVTIQQTKALMDYVQLPFDTTFANLTIPPGRTTIYNGIKNTTLVDSTYNANLISMKAILEMFALLPSDQKWVVLGDMRELGAEDKEEHEKLAKILSQINLQKIILMGSSINKYTYPNLQKLLNNDPKIISCENHRETLKYLLDNIQGTETILFKASQSQVFEGFIEPLLANPEDIKTLPRREIYWIDYRRQRGLV
jgi:UDP-N-acetylmuramoyl-tripeptide--D-alanyl-D-alanine ligase